MNDSGKYRGRREIAIVAHVEVYSKDGKDHPYLLMALESVNTGKINKKYLITWEVGDARGYEVVLAEVRPRAESQSGSVKDPRPTRRGAIQYKVDIDRSPFEYDLLYTLDGKGPCEAYARRPRGKPNCESKRVADDGRNPPPEILIP